MNAFFQDGYDMIYQASLKNGIRIIHIPVDGPVAHCALLINAGSRDEGDSEHGIAHLTEHLLFKGTKKRKPYHILSRIEDVGGEINAYTTKEETCIHASFLKEDYERALELFHDVLFNSIFPENEITKEKEVIIDEINSYRDNPSDMIFDDFEELLFLNQPLGRNILGTETSLQHINQDRIKQFIENHYYTNQMIISSAGNMDFNKFYNLVIKYFDKIPKKLGYPDRNISTPKPFSKEIKKGTYQVHGIMGSTVYPNTEKKRLSLALLTNILGGPGLNSRLNLSLREKYGYAYNIESSYNTYAELGVFTVYFGTDEKDLHKSLKKIKIEFDKLKNKKLGIQQLKKAKKQFTGQVLINASNHETLMLVTGKKLMMFNKAEELNKVISRINQISAEDIMEAAHELLDENPMATLIYR